MTSSSPNMTDSTPTEPIAIIGIGCRYPGGVDSPETFWKLLQEGIDAIGVVPKDRFDIDRYYAPGRQPGKIVTREGGFLPAIDQFDPAFFGISPREAASIDPQQRLLLEVTWEALERSGQTPQKLAGSRTGAFIGMWTSEYRENMFEALKDVTLHHLLGGYLYPAAGRISYIFDFQGPSVVLDTACSSSLVAIHLACQSLWTGESAMAIAGGVNIILRPELTIAESRSGMLSADGRCRFGDAKASGYVRSEGVGVVVLKLLSAALADSDPIVALIRGGAVNNDGRSGGVFSAPGYDAQIAVMRQAYERAGVQPWQVGYAEAHGTGTPTGDPVEIKALARILGENRPAGAPCLLGSVKTNIGHTEPAAGVAGLIKATLCLQQRAIPASLHFQTPNPDIPWADLPVRIQQVFTPWPEQLKPAFACVNSFGVTGTNAHIVLQEAPAMTPCEAQVTVSNEPYLIPLSAHMPQALKAWARKVLDWMKDKPDRSIALHWLGYTIAMRRAHHAHRLAFVARNHEELAAHLEAFLRGETLQGIASGHAHSTPVDRPVFVFSGMGPQWWGMGRELLAQEPVFRAAFEEVDALFEPLAGWSLRREFSAPEAESCMARADVAQPANMALQVGLAALWKSWGVAPSAIVGHSAGEVAAAHVAGILTLLDAVKVIYHRSRLQQLTTGEGKMLAIGLPQAEVEKRMAGRTDQVSVAAMNSPTSVTLSGDAEVLLAIENELKSEGFFVRFVHSDIPYHSPKMDRLRAELLEALQDIRVHPATTPIYSTVTGRLVDGDAYHTAYWWRNVRQPVYFAQAIARILANGYRNFLELSPHPVLATALSECLQHAKQKGNVWPSLRRMKPERAEMLGTLGELYVTGAEIAWPTLYPTGQCIALPTYPWQRQRIWFEEEEGSRANGKRRKSIARSGLQLHPFLGQHIQSAHQPGVHLWEADLDLAQLPYLKDHRIRDMVVFPAAAHIEMMLAATAEAFGPGPHMLEDISIKEALFLSEDSPRTGQLVISPQEPSQATCQIFFRPTKANEGQADWTLHSTSTIRVGSAATAGHLPMTFERMQAQARATVSGSEHNQHLHRRMLLYGPSFQGVQNVWLLPERQALGRLRLTDEIQAEAGAYRIQPALLDAALQLLFSAVAGESAIASNHLYLPVHVDSLCLYATPQTDETWSLAQLHVAQAEDFAGDVTLFDPEGQVLLEVRGLRCQRIRRTLQHILTDWLYEITWRPQARDRCPEPSQPSEMIETGSWLIFADANGVGDGLAQQLQAQGENCILVKGGPGYERIESDRYCLQVAEPLDFQRLLRDAFGNRRTPCRGIVHLWSLDGEAQTEMNLSALWNAQRLGCGSVLHLIQALVQSGWPNLPRLWLATRGAQPVGAESSPLCIDQTSLWGLGRVISLEYPQLPSVCVDLDPESRAEAVQVLLAELRSPDQENRVAWRQGVRHVARLTRWLSQAPRTEVPVKPDGSYLVTGGLGALGLQAAQWLARQGARHLILTGRTGVVHKAQEEAIRRMAEVDAQVLIVKADVAQEDDVARLLKQVKESLPPLKGIIHTAGVLDSGILPNQSWERFVRVMAPKIAGSWNLHVLSQDQPLDFFICFSSITSLLGWSGEGNYAAANAFLDGLAHYRRAQGLPALSVNWGLWGEVGMAARLHEREKVRWIERGVDEMSPEEGMRVLEALMRQPDAIQIGVAALNWAKFLTETTHASHRPFLETFMPAAVEAAQAATAYGEFFRQLEAAPLHARREMLIGHIRAQLTKVLKLSSLDLIESRQGLFDLGVDSLLAIELRNRLETSLGYSLRSTLLFDYPTLETLVGHLMHDVLPLEFSDGTEVETSVADEAESWSPLDALSEDDLADLLAQKLAAIQRGAAG